MLMVTLIKARGRPNHHVLLENRYCSATKHPIDLILVCELEFIHCDLIKYLPSGAGGTRSPPATPHRLPVGHKMADGVWKGVYP